VIQIEAIKLIPLPPYRAEILDVLQIHVNALPDQPIDDYLMVEAEGTIDLGPAYGSVHVAGMTIDEITKAIAKHLRKSISKPNVSVKWAKVSGAQPITGQYLVGPDGTINLRQYGVVHVAGKTTAEARIAIQGHLKQYLNSPEVVVGMAVFNSKVYYVITNVADGSEEVRSLPVTGNETVLDAISQINGLSQISVKKIWIARPDPRNSGRQQILRVDWNATIQGAQTATNYQICPGDRLYITDDELVTFGNVAAKLSATRGPDSDRTEQPQPTSQGGAMGRHYNSARPGL
jgi:protein involved in polysaccharide export with SLBB domain